MSYPLSTRPLAVSKDMLIYKHLDDVFTPQELENVIQHCGSLNLVDATVGKGDTSNVRKSKVNMFGINGTNKWIFDRMIAAATFMNNEYFRFDLTGFNDMQYTEYHGNDSGLYDFHIDCWMGNNTPTDHYFPRKLSFSLVLSDPSEYDGGQFEVRYSSESERISQKKGRLIAFPSFIPHRVAPVTRGIRKSLVFWIIGPKFK